MHHTPPKIAIGSFTVAFLTDGLWRNDGGCMFGVVPRELWKREHPPDEQNRIRLNLTCPLIIKGRDAVLVDTGIGNRLGAVEGKIFDHGEGWLLDHLRALGMEAGDVTHLIVSHLHFDHCGGIVRRRESGVLESSFPNARIFVQKGELAIAKNPRNERLRAAYKAAGEIVAIAERQFEAIDGDTEIVPGVMAVRTGGHTADHQIAAVQDGADSFVHLADIVPTRSHMRGPWNQAYDLDALRSMEEKARYLEQASGSKCWLSFAHDDSIFAARVRKEHGRFEITDRVPVSYAAEA
ncbi:MAG: MBL fold metallo-hydrolase [Candidatus Binatus sp.]|uniref:MBL fold metallo-hydrolase n=1 Tax=Candidatus Binatus sp. TaxID=2811406 RepID=UPI0027160DE9|nr:MBL fold metallo-hydrolase [Candidatus Binatus sp.]MDO8432375.1 MBL fold metallo-hydrolase [Candidatus Binatus sp.]